MGSRRACFIQRAGARDCLTMWWQLSGLMIFRRWTQAAVGLCRERLANLVIGRSIDPRSIVDHKICLLVSSIVVVLKQCP